MDFNTLGKSWEVTSELNELPPSTINSDIVEVEKHLDQTLPESLKKLYTITNGPSLLEGNLNIVPLKSDDFSNLSQFSTQLKKWGKQIPHEVLAFADDGSDGTFGIWLEKNELSDSPIIEIGESIDSPCLSLAGTSLLNFLLGWTAYYFLLCEVDAEALDIIQLPKELRFDASELDDEHFGAIRKWADPKLPDFYPDPYVQKLNTQTIRELLKRSAT